MEETILFLKILKQICPEPEKQTVNYKIYLLKQEVLALKYKLMKGAMFIANK